MKRVTVWAMSALCVAALHTGCSDETKWSAVHRMIETQFGDVHQMTTGALHQQMSSGQRPVLLDVRSSEEFAVSHLRGARRVDPDLEDLSVLDSIDRDADIVVYCSVGYRSARFAKRMTEAGFRNVVNLRGSIFRWANQGRRVVRDGAAVREVHPYDDVWGHLLRSELHAHRPGGAGAS
ncbi:rhodanese-like domain-containing protein [Longibacter sp.]|uniref:rhodanese-like domain-containing protein n=1 Tax=Longibacter sp. TaxID=2045415 RepID=UPI003EBAFAA0